MNRVFYVLATGVFLFSAISCSKRNVPTKSKSSTVEYKINSKIDSSNVHTTESTPVRETPVAKPKAPVSKVITVNDAAATKAVDGRMYYDVEGRRYWKNFKDGRYYLFDKSMYSNPDFKPPIKK